MSTISRRDTVVRCDACRKLITDRKVFFDGVGSYHIRCAYLNSQEFKEDIQAIINCTQGNNAKANAVARKILRMINNV